MISAIGFESRMSSLQRSHDTKKSKSDHLKVEKNCQQQSGKTKTKYDLVFIKKKLLLRNLSQS